MISRRVSIDDLLVFVVNGFVTLTTPDQSPPSSTSGQPESSSFVSSGSEQASSNETPNPNIGSVVSTSTASISSVTSSISDTSSSSSEAAAVQPTSTWCGDEHKNCDSTFKPVHPVDPITDEGEVGWIAAYDNEDCAGDPTISQEYPLIWLNVTMNDCQTFQRGNYKSARLYHGSGRAKTDCFEVFSDNACDQSLGLLPVGPFSPGNCFRLGDECFSVYDMHSIKRKQEGCPGVTSTC
ncbi:MAG: hypothetical protein Q9217_001799 [Psora testacea]